MKHTRKPNGSQATSLTAATRTPTSAAALVRDVLRRPGRPLDDPTRALFESRFGHDFSRVRIHADAEASVSADAVEARAYAHGRHIVLESEQAASDHGLMAHELAHTIQQRFADPAPAPAVKAVDDADERGATAASVAIMAGHAPGSLGVSRPGLARQAKPGAKRSDRVQPPIGADETVEDKQAVDTQAGQPVSRIVIDLRRGRVGFFVPAPKGVITGSVSTDLKPGRYTATLDAANQKWVFEGGQVKVGLRFSVSLDGANPWTLAYPERIPIYVGFSTERKGGGPEGDTSEDADADLLRIFDEAPGDIPDDPSIDNYVDYEYAPKWVVTGDTGAYSMQIKLQYIDGSLEPFDLSTVSDATVTDQEKEDAIANGTVTGTGRMKPSILNKSTVPKLWGLKQTILRFQQRLKDMGEAELLNFTIEHGFPAVFTIVTLNPFLAPMGPRAGSGGLRRPPIPPRGGSPGKPGAGGAAPKKASDTRVLVVGAETEAEFGYARGVASKGQRVDVVNPTETAAAKTFKAEGGNFVKGKIESLPAEPTYNLIREDFPYPTGASITTIEGVGARLARLKPGGRWVVVTEAKAEFLPTLKAEATRRGARVTQYGIPQAHEGAPQSGHPKGPERFVVIIEVP